MFSKIKSSFVLVLCAMVLFTLPSCKKDALTGVLTVNARDSFGTSLIGTTIYLYANEADFNNRLYTQSAVCNNSGQAKFNNLNPGIYFVDGQFLNGLGTYTYIEGSGAVSAGYETTITIQP